MNDDTLHPDWLEPVLHTAVVPERFQLACRAAADQAGMVVRLRLARAAIVARPTGIRAFLTDLAEAAGLAPSATFAGLGLPTEQSSDPTYASAWGRLAAALRLDWGEALLRLRLTFLEAAGLAPVRVAIRARGTGPMTDPLRLAEEEARAAGDQLDASAVDHLRSWEAAARAAFVSAQTAPST